MRQNDLVLEGQPIGLYERDLHILRVFHGYIEFDSVSKSAINAKETYSRLALDNQYVDRGM
jgi:hypothetical protein